MTREDLDALVRSAREGEREAAGRLLLEVQDRAVALAYGRLGDLEAARDAAQDALLDTHLHLAELREVAAFWGWFRTIVWKHCDRRTRRKRLELDPLGEHEGGTRRTPRQEASLERQRAGEWIRRQIEELPEAQRQVVALHYLADQSTVQIGALLEIDPNTAKQRLHAARQRLKKRSTPDMESTLGDVTAATGPLRAFSDRELADEIQLFLAVRTGDEAAVRQILDANPGLVDTREGWDVAAFPGRELPFATSASPLIRAAEQGHVEIVELLLARGADVDGACGCMTGESPLWAAVASGQLAASRRLLSAGADPNRPGQSGIAPLHIAAMRGAQELVGLLLDHGADASLADPAGRTAAEWARLKGHHDLSSRLDGRSGEHRDLADRPAIEATGEVLWTGIKAVDLFAPIPDGGLVRVEGGAGVGRNVLLAEISHAASRWPDTEVVWVAWEREAWSGSELQQLLHEADLGSRVHVLRHPHGDDPQRARTLGARALAFVDGLLEVGGASRVMMLVFEPEGMRADVEAMLPAMAARSGLTALLITPWQVACAAPLERLPPFDALLAMSPALAKARCYPAVDPAHSDSVASGGRAATLAGRCRKLLCTEDASQPERERAQRLRAYLTQPFHVAEPNSGRPGERVEGPKMLADVERILEGAADGCEPATLFYRGALPPSSYARSSA